MKVSIKDIAEKLKVSPALVSMVLNGKEKEGRVSKETAEKIRKVASELNYSPNRFAKGLKKGNSFILGLIVADISNPFFATLTRHIEDEAERFNYKIIIGSSDENAAKMASLIDIMKSYQVDGFLIVPAENSQNQIEQLMRENYAVVLIDRYFTELKTDCIITNNSKTAYDAANYLISQGCRNIAAFTYQSGLSHFADRLTGYKNAINDAGLTMDKNLTFHIHFDNIFEEIKQGIKTLVERTPNVDGIFFLTDALTLNAIKVFKELGIDPSAKYRMLSFDENDTFNFLSFPIPHFAQSLDIIGKEAVNRLLEQIKSQPKPEPKKILVDSKWFEK